MQLIVKNCGECPFCEYNTEYCDFWCQHPETPIETVIEEFYTIPIICPLKTSPITIKLKEYESK